MIRLLMIGLLLFLLVGCASNWEHATKHTNEFYADDRICQSEAGGAYRGIEPGQERISYESCMFQKGWNKKQSFWFFDPPDQK